MTTGRFRRQCVECGASLEGAHEARKYCNDRCKKRYQRNENHPPPAFVGSYDLLPEHLKAMFTPGDPAKCWISKNRSSSGYATSTSVKMHKSPLYRLLYMMMVGPIPPGLVLDHLCDNGDGGCVNWHHLKVCTQRENTLRSTNGQPCADYARQTHCKKGHPFTPENTRVVKRKRGHASRICLTCHRERQQRYIESQGNDELNRKRRDHYRRNRAGTCVRIARGLLNRRSQTLANRCQQKSMPISANGRIWRDE